MKAPSAENAELATNALAQRLSENPNLFPLVGQPDSGDFFERNIVVRERRYGVFDGATQPKTFGIFEALVEFNVEFHDREARLCNLF